MFGTPAKIFLGALLAASNTAALHYEKPPCGSDEKAVQIMGVVRNYCLSLASKDRQTILVTAKY